MVCYFAAPTTVCSKEVCFAFCPDSKYKSLRLDLRYSGMPLPTLLLLKHERVYVVVDAAMSRGLSFWNGALDTAPIDAFEHNRNLERYPPELLSVQPLFKRQQNLVLIFFRSAGEKLGQNSSGKQGQGFTHV